MNIIPPIYILSFVLYFLKHRVAAGGPPVTPSLSGSMVEGSNFLDTPFAS